MARWDPDAQGRLRQAAVALYLERGYEATTVAEIAERAGLTKRTFFRYFADKREVLFAGSESLQTDIVTALRQAPAEVPPIEAVLQALATGGTAFGRYPDFARQRRDLIASSPDLQERELIKLASLTAAVAGALRDRGLDPRQAGLTAQAGVAAFTAAYERWVQDPAAGDFPALVRESLDDLRRAISAV